MYKNIKNGKIYLFYRFCFDYYNHLYGFVL